MVIAFPAAAVLGGIVTIALALVSDDGLVVDDYYQHGLEINRVLEREEAAAAFGLAMDVTIGPDRQSILLALAAKENFTYPAQLDAVLAHATRSGSDHALNFLRVGNASYRADTPALPPGRWYLNLDGEQWRLVKKITIP